MSTGVSAGPRATAVVPLATRLSVPNGRVPRVSGEIDLVAHRRQPAETGVYLLRSAEVQRLARSGAARRGDARGEEVRSHDHNALRLGFV